MDRKILNLPFGSQFFCPQLALTHRPATVELAVTRELHQAVTTKPLPAGEVTYQILVIKNGYTTPVYYLYSGTEKLASLKAAQGTELILGAAQVTGWRDASYQSKDKIEYKVVVKIGDEEKVSLTSAKGFDAMAKHARKIDSPE